MAAEAVTPVDEIGMPLPLAPSLAGQSDASPEKRDWHHHFHPRRSEILGRDLGGQAVRNARIQLSDWWQHHIDYHNYFKGPELPATPQQQFGITVLACAGYVPEEAIDFQGDGPVTVRLTTDQRRYLWRSGDLKVAAPDVVRNFLDDYTLAQNLQNEHEKEIDEFLNTSNHKRRYSLGGVLLNLAIAQAVEPINPFYVAAWERGFINRSSSSRPHRLVRAALDLKKRSPSLIGRLYDTLHAA